MPNIPSETELWLIPITFLALAFSVFVIYARKEPEEGEDIVVSQTGWTGVFRNLFTPASPKHDQYEQEQKPFIEPGKTLLPHNVWIKLVQDQIDKAPHTLIVGSTGSGKTWLAQAIIATRPGHVAILDPKWTPRKWGNAPAITIDDDLSYQSLEQACQLLLDELKKRQVALKHGQETFSPLTVVVEELPTLLDECPTAPILFKRLGQLGRELRIRVVGLSQSDRVKTLKLEGEGDARSNYLFIRLGEHAIRSCPASANQTRPACIEWHKETYPIETSRIPELIKQPISEERWWVAEPSTTREPAAPPRVWTANHIKVATWLGREPTISIREIARRLYPGSDGSGSYSMQAKAIIADIQSVSEVACDVWEHGQKPNNLAPEDQNILNGMLGIPLSNAVYRDTEQVSQNTGDLTDDEIRQLHFREGWSKTKITTMLKGSKQERLARVSTALNVKIS
jgi:hypothetical protein